MASALFQDPCHPYAVHLIELLHRRHGHRAVCFFTDRKMRVREASAYPTLRSPLVEAVYDVSIDALGPFAERLRRRHDIVGVVPFAEPTVLAAAELAERLDLGWNDVETIRRFRDKHALKEHLRAHYPQIRVNSSRLVRGLEDVLPSGKPVFARYVVKPNDGWGNRDIAYFDESTPRHLVEAVVRKAQGPLVLEEYVSGIEYFVNGQVDARGEITVVAIFRYTRVHANGCSNLDYETRNVRHADPVFALLEAYTREVIRASGLVRSPFHLEIKVDERGPCLIEAGARLPGHENAWVCNALHGGGLDVFDAAAHFYVSTADYGPLQTDWNRYDSTDAVYVHGIAMRRERICTVDGDQEVEALPCFAGWVKKPKLGDRMVPTVDSLTAPWCVLLVAHTPDPGDSDRGPKRALITEPMTADHDAAAVRQLLRINGRPAVFQRARVACLALRARAEFEVRWGVARATLPDDGAAPREVKATMRGATIELFARAADAAVRRMQLAGWVRARGRAPAPHSFTKSRVEQAREVLGWIEQYLGGPHPELGRKGAICPFVQKAAQIDRLFLAFHDEIDGSSRFALRAVLLDYAKRLKTRFPPTEADNSFASFVVVLPNIVDDRLGVMDRVHAEIKSHLMESDLMAAVFHKLCDKPAVRNGDFALYRNAPLPCIALRHMDVRDIVFLGHNRVAFERYRQRFGARFSEGRVSNDFDYVDLFHAADRRFPRK
jgi:hypothetical protein